MCHVSRQGVYKMYLEHLSLLGFWPEDEHRSPWVVCSACVRLTSDPPVSLSQFSSQSLVCDFKIFSQSSFPSPPDCRSPMTGDQQSPGGPGTRRSTLLWCIIPGEVHSFLGLQTPFITVRCMTLRPTSLGDSWVPGVAQWATARLSDRMKSPGSHWN